jgi:hypothetical protein
MSSATDSPVQLKAGPWDGTRSGQCVWVTVAGHELCGKGAVAESLACWVGTRDAPRALFGLCPEHYEEALGEQPPRSETVKLRDVSPVEQAALV